MFHPYYQWEQLAKKPTQNVLKNLCFLAFFPFSKKMGVLAARFGAMTFTRALGYAKRLLSPAPDIAGSRKRQICTIYSLNISKDESKWVRDHVSELPVLTFSS